jgi:hypothetical protein
MTRKRARQPPTPPSPTSTLEIERLENSLRHLKRTQDELRDYSDHDDDPELALALKENEAVMSVSVRSLFFLILNIIIFLSSIYIKPQCKPNRGCCRTPACLRKSGSICLTLRWSRSAEAHPIAIMSSRRPPLLLLSNHQRLLRTQLWTNCMTPMTEGLCFNHSCICCILFFFGLTVSGD